MAEMTAAEAIELLKNRTPAWLEPAMFFISESESKQIAALLEQQQAEIERCHCCGICENWQQADEVYMTEDRCKLDKKPRERWEKCNKWEAQHD